MSSRWKMSGNHGSKILLKECDIELTCNPLMAIIEKHCPYTYKPKHVFFLHGW